MSFLARQGFYSMRRAARQAAADQRYYDRQKANEKAREAAARRKADDAAAWDHFLRHTGLNDPYTRSLVDINEVHETYFLWRSVWLWLPFAAGAAGLIISALISGAVIVAVGYDSDTMELSHHLMISIIIVGSWWVVAGIAFLTTHTWTVHCEQRYLDNHADDIHQLLLTH